MLGGVIVAYSVVRELTDDRADEAYSNAEWVVKTERSAGVFVEPAVQDATLSSALLTNLANAIYIAYWPLIFVTLVWLMRRTDAYGLYRNALLASGGSALALFAGFPLAPPRFLPHHGFADTIALHSDIYRAVNSSELINEFGAMPSVHFGWVLLAAIAVVRLSGRRLVRVVAAAMPGLMLWAIVATGNHYLVDSFVGGILVLGCLAFVQRLANRRRRFERALQA